MPSQTSIAAIAIEVEVIRPNSIYHRLTCRVEIDCSTVPLLAIVTDPSHTIPTIRYVGGRKQFWRPVDGTAIFRRLDMARCDSRTERNI